jgi:hypothetical protein
MKSRQDIVATEGCDVQAIFGVLADVPFPTILERAEKRWNAAQLLNQKVERNGS